MEAKIEEVCVWPELLRQMFPVSDPDGVLWNEVEKGKFGIYHIAGGFLALGITETALHVECFEGDNRGGNLITERTLDILRRFAFACGRDRLTCNVTRFENVLKKRYGFVVVGRTKTQVQMLKVFQWVNLPLVNPPIPQPQVRTQPTMQPT